MAWRIKHKPTGMYYRPYTMIWDKETNRHVKTNITKVGKLYLHKPTDIQFKIWFSGAYDRQGKRIPLSDWEVVELREE